MQTPKKTGWFIQNPESHALVPLVPAPTIDHQLNRLLSLVQWEFQDPIDGGTLVPYKALHSPYRGLIYGRHLHLIQKTGRMPLKSMIF